ncbi:Rossmann-like and DUF2520 domain-containing protein [Desulforegula conservatrix]|uniref:Rossmann-like and DUF2520 domain-containing protein n=1 Tax=Desulforegula conservatrix TaxID=153026 RepID=UPI0004257635|nr:Rossmann-like and DUF2520 domain-containing protein [Desulforegula conservatrix]
MPFCEAINQSNIFSSGGPISQNHKTRSKIIAIIGCGRAGSKLGFWLSRSGYKIEALFDPDITKAEKLSIEVNAEKVCSEASHAASCSDIIFISTPDSLIKPTCAEIAKGGGFNTGSIVFHLSGSLPSSILLEAAKKGALTASFHPLQSLAGGDTEINPFKDILIAVEGYAEAVAQAKKMAIDLGARPYEIDGNAKTLYHASAVIASNYLVSLMKMASEVMAASGIPEEKAFEFLLPLVKGTLANMEKMGVEQALTGPVSRGDATTVIAHINGITEKTPDLKKAYIELGKIALQISESQNFIPEHLINQLRDIFESS